MQQTEMSLKEIARRGWEIYVAEIRPKVIDEHLGQFLVVDVESGDYEVDENAAAATRRMVARHPDGHRYLIHVGYRTTYSIGAAPQPDIT